MGLPQRDDRLHTYGEYRSWPEDVRYELIDGVAYAMAPAPSPLHQLVLGELHRQVANILKDRPCHVYLAPFDVRLPKGDEADDAVDTVVQPDLSVICDTAKLDDAGCRGAPDWVVEVLSQSTAGHDQILKRAAYERAGVREYWLVHPVDRVVAVYRLGPEGFGKPEIRELTGTHPVAAVPEVEVDWDAFAGIVAEPQAVYGRY